MSFFQEVTKIVVAYRKDSTLTPQWLFNQKEQFPKREQHSVFFQILYHFPQDDKNIREMETYYFFKSWEDVFYDNHWLAAYIIL